MKRRSSFFMLSSYLFILLLAACRGDELPLTPQAQNPSVLTFTVAAETAETRSVPESPSTETGVQYVQNVKLYLFKESDGNTTYVGAEPPTAWNSLTLKEGEEGKTVSKSYPLQTALEPNTTYTLLAVGYETENIYDIQTNGQRLEDQTGRTDNGDGTYTDGAPVTLSDLSSVLTSGKGKTNIQTNEYFTGTETATTDADGHLPEDTRVTMRRRVAGLSACFELTNFNEKPQAVAIMLCRPQHYDVPTVKRIWQEPFFTDHGERFLRDATEPKDLPQCLLWIDAPEENQGTKLMPQESARNTAKANGYHANGSAYALPQEAPGTGEEKNYTQAVVVYNTDGEVICTKRAALAKDGKLIFATDLGTGIVDDESFYRYPIVANRFYRFGTESQAMEVEFDENNPFEVVVEPEWEGMPDLDFGD